MMRVKKRRDGEEEIGWKEEGEIERRGNRSKNNGVERRNGDRRGRYGREMRAR